jgi:hypothetical protein
MSCWVFWVCLCLVMSNNLSYHMSTIGVPYCDFRYVFRITRCSFRLYLQLGVGGLMSWCTTPIDYMSNMAGLLWATGAACSSQEPGLATDFWWVRVARLFWFYLLRFLFCLSSSCVFRAQCCQFLWRVHSYCPFGFLWHLFIYLTSKPIYWQM